MKLYSQFVIQVSCTPRLLTALRLNFTSQVLIRAKLVARGVSITIENGWGSWILEGPEHMVALLTLSGVQPYAQIRVAPSRSHVRRATGFCHG